MKVGVIGLGKVAQIIHLPILEDLSDRYKICALCDVSPNLLGLIGERYGVDRLYTDASDLIEQVTLDAVFVLNSDEYHTDCVVAALKRGRHVFVEKPLCLTHADYVGELYALYLLSEHQRAGIGRRLFGSVARALAAGGSTSLLAWVLTRNPSRRFYEAAGGQLLGSQEIEIGGARLEEVAYGWLDIESIAPLG